MANAVRQAIQRMGLPNNAAVFAVNTMGLDTLDAWRDMHMDEHLSEFAKSLRSPGGTIGQGANQQRHPGFVVSPLAISNLKVMRLALKHHQLIQRAVTPAMVDMAWIRTWEFLVDFRKEAAGKKPKDEELPKVKMSDWAKTKETITTHFDEVFGPDGVPLSYIIRDDSEVPAEADDNQADNYAGDHIKELIRRAPHTGATYNADNRTMCRLLKKICQDTPAYTYIKKYKADGRQAWLDLMDKYLGPQYVNIQATKYEAKLQNTTYEGETRNWGIDKYIDTHVDSFEHLVGLKPHGYDPPDEGTRIRYLDNGVKTDKLKTCMEVIRGNPQYNTFDAVARRIKDAVELMKPKQMRKVSAVSVNQKKGDEPFPGVQADMSVEDKYYQPKEWSQLSAAQKKGVLKKRRQRESSGGKKKNNQSGKKSGKKLNKTIAALERRLSAVEVGGDDDQDSDDNSSDSEDEQPAKKKQKKTTNRNHPNTTRRN